jgi:hypothetical protein
MSFLSLLFSSADVNHHICREVSVASDMIGPFAKDRNLSPVQLKHPEVSNSRDNDDQRHCGYPPNVSPVRIWLIGIRESIEAARRCLGSILT